MRTDIKDEVRSLDRERPTANDLNIRLDGKTGGAAMTKPVSVSIPHSLGKDEARRRLQEGFVRIRQQLSGGLVEMVSFNDRLEGDRLHFEGGAIGQRISGRLDVLADSVQIQLDLPDLLALIAERITGRLKKETQVLLEKK
jgi:Putative polyhydroxyalkanoic acid system protein (PHA_gran_rgn)